MLPGTVVGMGNLYCQHKHALGHICEDSEPARETCSSPLSALGCSLSGVQAQECALQWGSGVLINVKEHLFLYFRAALQLREPWKDGEDRAPMRQVCLLPP